MIVFTSCLGTMEVNRMLWITVPKLRTTHYFPVKGSFWALLQQFKGDFPHYGSSLRWETASDIPSAAVWAEIIRL